MILQVVTLLTPHKLPRPRSEAVMLHLEVQNADEGMTFKLWPLFFFFGGWFPLPSPSPFQGFQGLNITSPPLLNFKGSCGDFVTHTIHGTNGIFPDPWMVDFYGFHVGKYTSHMDAMGEGGLYIP